MAAAHLDHVVEPLVQRVLALVVDHPPRQQTAAAGDDARRAVPAQREMLESHAGMDRHVVHALPGPTLDGLEQQLGGQILDARRPVDRHGPDRHGGRLEHAWRVLSIRLPVDRSMTVSAPHLCERLSFSTSSASCDADVDLDPGLQTDGDRIERRVMDVGRDDHPPWGGLGVDRLGGQLLALGDAAHLRREHAWRASRIRGSTTSVGRELRAVRHRSPFAGMTRIRFGGSAHDAAAQPEVLSG